MAVGQEKKSHIIAATLVVLKEVGSEGLTMRRVATQAGISLGNLQYHFKGKPALLAGLGAHYFAKCATMLDNYQHQPISGPAEAQMRRLILHFLDHLDHINDMCRIFREMWALAARDETIQAQLMHYYQELTAKLVDRLAPLTTSPDAAQRAASLLLPYFEGYSIMAGALSMDKKAIADMLTHICMNLE